MEPYYSFTSSQGSMPGMFWLGVLDRFDADVNTAPWWSQFLQKEVGFGQR